MPATSQLTFITTPGTIALGGLIVLVTAALAYLGWRRGVRNAPSAGWSCFVC